MTSAEPVTGSDQNVGAALFRTKKHHPANLVGDELEASDPGSRPLEAVVKRHVHKPDNTGIIMM